MAPKRPKKGLPFRGAVGPSLTTRRFQSVSRSQETEIRRPLPGTDALETLWKRFGNAPSRVAQRAADQEIIRATAVESHIQIDASAVRWRRWERFDCHLADRQGSGHHGVTPTTQPLKPTSP
jgi:hypothetical protein